MVRDSTTNRSAMVILEISMAELLRLDLLQACYFPVLLILKLKIHLAGTLFTQDHKQQFHKELNKSFLNKYVPYML